jgi:lipopolysaccharide assembly outer membrane protein LptD (OstA)
MELNIATGEMTARGNVVFQTPTSKISAESVVFNTKTKLGTFYAASGLAELGGRVSNEEKSMFGTLEPDIYFYGQTIEKVGDDRYVISKGAFTTCVQPTPRWEIVSTGTSKITHSCETRSFGSKTSRCSIYRCCTTRFRATIVQLASSFPPTAARR